MSHSANGVPHLDYLPPVILFGADTSIGLPLVREIGARGVKVIAVTRHRRGLGRFSRYTHAWAQMPTDPTERIAQLNALAAQYGAPFVISTSEDLLVIARRAWEEGKLTPRPLSAPLKALETANDKTRSEPAAQAAGLVTPLTWAPASLAELDNPPADFTFPAIIKWRDKNVMWKRLAELGLPMKKAEYIPDLPTLKERMSVYHAVGTLPIVQTFATGIYLGINLLMHQGRAVLAQQEMEIAMWPPEQGIDCVLKGVPLTEFVEERLKTERMLASLGWEGPCCVEFRYDPVTQKVVWMENNGRFWGSQPLAHHGGLHFGWALYCWTGLGRDPGPMQYEHNIITRYWLPETKRLVGVLFNWADGGYWTPQAPRPAPMAELRAYIGRFFDPRTRWYLWRWDDPLPVLADIWYMSLKGLRLLAGLAGRKLGDWRNRFNAARAGR